MWNHIVGHKKQIQHLQEVLSSQRLPNALLFSGLRGIGKASVAKIFAAELLQNREKVERDIHPDLFSLLPDGERIKIEQVRNLIARIQFHPLEAPAKLVIVDDADRMTDAAANALLKTLEEPPPATHFLLITPFPHRLLATIRSRCQKLGFAPLDEEAIVTFLEKQEGRSRDEAILLAKISQGSLSVALSLDPAFISTTLERFRVLTQKGSAADVIAASEEWSRAGEKAPLILEILANHFREVLITSPHARADRAIEQILSTRQALETTANKQLLFEELFFSLAGHAADSRTT